MTTETDSYDHPDGYEDLEEEYRPSILDEDDADAGDYDLRDWEAAEAEEAKEGTPLYMLAEEQAEREWVENRDARWWREVGQYVD